MIPVDLVEILREELRGEQREPDGYLHASLDLVGSLRHTQLRFVGAPTIDNDLVSSIRLRTGTFWHTHLGEMLVKLGIPVMREVNLTPWMPEGWSGTADWLFYSPKYEAFVLGDLKTAKGEAMKFKEKEGMSLEHYWQLSAYWHAAVNMGLPMVKGFGVLYLPMNDDLRADATEPVVVEATPIDEDTIKDVMQARRATVLEYAAVINDKPIAFDWVNEYLVPPVERVQKVFWDAKAGHWNLKFVPHWLTDYCPYPNELCDCSEQGETKIGHYFWYNDGLDEDQLVYVPRKGYENIAPDIRPDEKEIRRRLKT